MIKKVQNNKKALINVSAIFAVWMILSLPVYASIKGDGSTNTNVNKKDFIFRIDGGKKIGKNLLHSFLEFSLGKKWKAQFEIPKGLNISNIIARVTGNNLSRINGELKIDGGAQSINLFLINPNGILFGPNAKLSLNGSFLASTAESITFSNGYNFSATRPTPLPPLVKLGVPVGLQFGKNPAPIIGNFKNPGSGLKVEEGQTLALIGGDVILHGSGFHPPDPPNPPKDPSVLSAFQGAIYIGSIGSDQTVGLQPLKDAEGWNLDFSTVKKFKDVLIDNALIVGGGDTDIYLYGNKVQFQDRSQIGGINFGDEEVNKIFINATESLMLDNSTIDNGNSGSLANGSEIRIKTNALKLNSSFILTSSFGAGSSKAGKILIDANQISLQNFSQISAASFGRNTSGKVVIKTKTLKLDTESEISSESKRYGKGGVVDISADLVELNNGSKIVTTAKNSKQNNQAGDLKISTDILRLDNGSTISTSGQSSKNGEAGNIDIFARSVELNHQSQIEANSILGNGGNINLNVKDILKLRNQSNISTSSTKAGNGGNIKINAGVIAAVPSEDSNIKATAKTGNGGDIKITTKGLFGIYTAKEDAPFRSDITTSSQFGLDGNIDINILASRSVINFSTTPRLLKTKSLETVCFDNRRG
ncbi:MAG TPA: filamentous hemagglutinin N-terminal domain-containing protein, partial [Stenomitos sp.]